MGSDGAQYTAASIIPLPPVALKDDQKDMKKNELKHMLKEAATKLYEAKEAEFPEAEQIREIERVILLKVIDAKVDGSY